MATLAAPAPNGFDNSAVLDPTEALEEARANTRAVIQVIDAVGRETGTSAVLQSTLRAVKEGFGWDYGACWMIDRSIEATSFRTEEGNLGPAYDEINRNDHYQKGRGLTGRTWQTADVIFIPDLSVIKDSQLVKTARAAGAVAAVSFPFIVQEEVTGVLFFFAFRAIHPSQDRLDTLRNIGRLVGQAFHRIEDLEREKQERAALVNDAAKVLAIVQAAQRGDLTRAMPHCADEAMNEVGRGLGQFLSAMRQSLRGILHTANSLSGAAQQLNAMSAEMRRRAEETSNTAAGANQASHEVTANVRSIADGSTEMVSSIRDLSSNANRAALRFQAAVRTAATARGIMGKLGESSKDIETIVKAVRSIARQTNLLSLNASIEAARAGAAGQAFMVVANEVKALARESATATDRISEKVEAIQKDTAGAVEAIGEITVIVDEVSQISSTIASTAEQQSATTSEIGKHVLEAATGSASITEKIGAVAGVALTAQREAGETQAAAHALTTMATELHTLVSRFKVD